MPKNKNDVVLFSMLYPLELPFDLDCIFRDVMDEVKKINNFDAENCYPETDVDEEINLMRFTIYKKSEPPAEFKKGRGSMTFGEYLVKVKRLSLTNFDVEKLNELQENGRLGYYIARQSKVFVVNCYLDYLNYTAPTKGEV